MQKMVFEEQGKSPDADIPASVHFGIGLGVILAASLATLFGLQRLFF